MTELVDLLLDDTGDLMLAEHEDGEVDLVLWAGAETVLQAVATRLRVALGSIWYNRQAGIDHEFLFFSRTLTNFVEELQPIARAAFRRAILETDGVVGFEKQRIRGEFIEPDISFEVNTKTRVVKPIIPCLEIDCANTVVRGVIPERFGPAIEQGGGGTTLPPVETFLLTSHSPEGDVQADTVDPTLGVTSNARLVVTFEVPVDISTLPTTYLRDGVELDNVPLNGPGTSPLWLDGGGNTYFVTVPDGGRAGVLYEIDYSGTMGVDGQILTGQTVFLWQPAEV